MKRILSVLLLICSTTAAADRLEDAQRALNAGNYKQALNDLDKYLDRNPQNAEALFNKGLALVMLERDNDAIKVFSDLARDFPELPEPYNNLAVLYARAGRYEEARDALEAALVSHPSYATAHENLGDIYAALANAAYNRAIVLDKANGTVREKQELVAQLIDLEGRSVPPVQVSSSQGRTTTAAAAAPSRPAATPRPTAVPAPVRQTTNTAAATPVQAAASYDIPQTFSTEPVLNGAAAASPASSSVAPADKTAALARVESWRAAWSAKDPDAYLANYSPNFVPATGVTRSTWESQRRTRVVRPRSILIQVIDPKVSSSNAQLQVEFVQIYESNTYSDQVRKRLVLERVGGEWLILKESVIG